MNRYFKKSLTPVNKSNTENLDYSMIKMPQISFGYMHKSVQQLKKELVEKLEYQRALKRLDISPNPTKYRNPFRSTPEPLFKNIIKRNKFIQDNGLDEFIDAMFFNINNSYRLLNKDLVAPIDYFTAEIQVRNLKRLKPLVKVIEAEDVDKPPLEDFWFRNISKNYTIRWDTFEEAICRHFILNINTSIGTIRKLNWESLLKKLLRKISSKSNDIELWPGHPGLASISYKGPVVTLSNFQSCVTSGKFKSLAAKSLSSETFYICERYKKNTYTFACGAEYRGEWKSYMRDGLAKMIYNEDFEYDGYLFKGRRHGYGSCTALGGYYKGYWEEDLIDGPGEITYSDGSGISGVWKKNQVISGRLKWSGGEYTGYLNPLYFEGSGVFINKQGDIKKGIWVKGKLNGDGEIVLKNGNLYKGTFVDDHLEGQGYIDTSIFTYNGEVKQSLPEGFGRIVYKNISSDYEGYFSAGTINGKGVYKIDAHLLKGEFILGKLSGKGEKTIGSISKYIGDFSDSLMHGKGILRISSENCKSIYNGEFKVNKFHGNGKLRIGDCEYKGGLAHGELHGNGEILLDKVKYKGTFFKNEANGRGSVHFIDGSYYDGDFSYSRPFGSGEALDANGYWLAANFLEGKPIIRHRLRNDFFTNLQEFKEKLMSFCALLQWINENICSTDFNN